MSDSSALSAFDNFHIVLVEPQQSLNVGSVARAMANLGFQHLHLVAPRGYDKERAKITACGGDFLLDSLTVHEHFTDMLASMQEVIGFAMRTGENPAHFTTLPQLVTGLSAAPPRQIALVFGPEDSGLRNEHLAQCSRVVRIPSAPQCPSLNLSQAVLVVLYELTRTLPAGLSTASDDVPTWNEFYQLDRLIDSVMTESGFVRVGTPSPAPALVKNLFRRFSLNRHEVSVLLGFFGRVSRVLVRSHPNE